MASVGRSPPLLHQLLTERTARAVHDLRGPCVDVEGHRKLAVCPGVDDAHSTCSTRLHEGKHELLLVSRRRDPDMVLRPVRDAGKEVAISPPVRHVRTLCQRCRAALLQHAADEDGRNGVLPREDGRIDVVAHHGVCVPRDAPPCAQSHVLRVVRGRQVAEEEAAQDVVGGHKRLGAVGILCHTLLLGFDVGVVHSEGAADGRRRSAANGCIRHAAQRTVQNRRDNSRAEHVVVGRRVRRKELAVRRVAQLVVALGVEGVRHRLRRKHVVQVVVGAPVAEAVHQRRGERVVAACVAALRQVHEVHDPATVRRRNRVRVAEVVRHLAEQPVDAALRRPLLHRLHAPEQRVQLRVAAQHPQGVRDALVARRVVPREEGAAAFLHKVAHEVGVLAHDVGVASLQERLCRLSGASVAFARKVRQGGDVEVVVHGCVVHEREGLAAVILLLCLLFPEQPTPHCFGTKKRLREAHRKCNEVQIL
eukprot:Rhum_TRINITY_DN20917_c0_g1::Rhum_TRINITY_DN20917_c0_g1_i1::g.172638::m.172638